MLGSKSSGPPSRDKAIWTLVSLVIRSTRTLRGVLIEEEDEDMLRSIFVEGFVFLRLGVREGISLFLFL